MTLLLCALGLFLYLLNSSKNEVLRLRQELYYKDRLIEDLRRQLDANPQPSHPALPSPSTRTFVRVIFRADDEKYYDYFVGNNDVQVGDFVEVFASDKDRGVPTCKVAQVVYVSKPGEVSDYAKSVIVKKVDRHNW